MGINLRFIFYTHDDLSFSFHRIHGKYYFETKKITVIAQTYEETQKGISHDLKKEFTQNLRVWNAVLDSLTLSIRFEDPEILFQVGSAELNQHFKNILDNFSLDSYKF